MTVNMSLAGLGQVLEFMYTAKLSLSSENVDDVLAVASFLQMQDIIIACHALKSLDERDTIPGENPEAPAIEGKPMGGAHLNRWLLVGLTCHCHLSCLVFTFSLMALDPPQLILGQSTRGAFLPALYLPLCSAAREWEPCQIQGLELRDHSSCNSSYVLPSNCTVPPLTTWRRLTADRGGGICVEPFQRALHDA